jgi:hypothetical protein
MAATDCTLNPWLATDVGSGGHPQYNAEHGNGLAVAEVM